MTIYKKMLRVEEPRFENAEHGVYLADKGWKQGDYDSRRLPINGHVPFTSRNEIFGDFSDGDETVTIDFRKLYESPRIGKKQHLIARIDAMRMEFNGIPLDDDGQVDYVQLRKDLKI